MCASSPSATAIRRLPVSTGSRPTSSSPMSGCPGKNGYEVASYIKSQPRLAHIPVVLLTGAFEPIDQVKADQAGCDGVLAKPFEPQLVISLVNELLAGARGGSAPPARSARPAVPVVLRTPDTPAAARVVKGDAGGDSALAGRLLRRARRRPREVAGRAAGRRPRRSMSSRPNAGRRVRRRRRRAPYPQRKTSCRRWWRRTRRCSAPRQARRRPPGRRHRSPSPRLQTNWSSASPGVSSRSSRTPPSVETVADLVSTIANGSFADESTESRVRK